VKLPPIKTRLDQYAEYLSRGMSNPDIADRMGISLPAGRTYLQRIIRQLGEQAR